MPIRRVGRIKSMIREYAEPGELTPEEEQ